MDPCQSVRDRLKLIILTLDKHNPNPNDKTGFNIFLIIQSLFILGTIFSERFTFKLILIKVNMTDATHRIKLRVKSRQITTQFVIVQF